MKKITVIICSILLLCALAFSLTGCNTVKGAGKDIEKTGEVIQEAVD